MDRMRLDIKRRTAGSKGAVGYRVKEAEKRAVVRNTARSNAFDRGRNMGLNNAIGPLDEEEPHSSENKVVTKAVKISGGADLRRIRLEKWKEEKLKQQVLQKFHQKPVFKTGVVHHSVGSPEVFGVPVVATKIAAVKTVETTRVLRPRNGVATRAAKDNIPKPTKLVPIQAIPNNKKFVAPKGIKSMVLLTEPSTPEGMSARKKLQEKAHGNKRHPVSSTVTVSLFPSSAGKTQQSNLKRPLFLPKSATPNVNLPKRVKAEGPLNSNAAKLRPVPVTQLPRRMKSAVKSVATPNAGASGRINSVHMPTTTPSSGLTKKAGRANENKVPSNIKGSVASPTSSLSPSKDAVSRPMSEGACDTQTSPEFPIEAKKPKSRVSLCFKPSPNVTIERGKYSDRRKSVKSRLTNDLSPLAVPIESPSTSECAIRPVSCFGAEPLHPGVRYRNILNSEVDRLNILCKDWTDIKSEHLQQLSENVNSLIDLAVGQTQLLIRSKLQQFRGLTYDCENGVCIPPVTEEDLQGFWEMVYMQVENIDKQFSQLTELKQNNFVEKSPCKVVQKNANQKKNSKPKAPKMTKSSGIRALIAAQRQKQSQQDATKPVVTPKITPRYSMISGSARQSGGRRSLLKDVLNNQSIRRSQHLSPIIMRVSQMAKNVGSPTASDLTSEKSSVENVHSLTPYKSILKDVSLIGSCTKECRKTVNFGENTIRSLTPDFEAFQSPVEEPLESDVDLINQQKKDVVSDVPPAENLPVREKQPPSPSPKRRTRGSTRNKISAQADTTESKEMEKENQSTNSQVLIQTRTTQSRQCVLTFGDVETKESTPVANGTRRSYRKTPFKATHQNDETVPEAMSDTSLMEEMPSIQSANDTPTSARPRRSYRKTPYKEKTSQSSDEKRASLLPVNELEPSTATATRFSTGDLISFSTPQRRSSRVSKKK